MEIPIPGKPVFIFRQGPGGRLNIKMPSYQYRDSHVKDKTVSPTVLSLTWESPYLGKTVFIFRRALLLAHKTSFHIDWSCCCYFREDATRVDYVVTLNDEDLSIAEPSVAEYNMALGSTATICDQVAREMRQLYLQGSSSTINMVQVQSEIGGAWMDANSGRSSSDGPRDCLCCLVLGGRFVGNISVPKSVLFTLTWP